MGFRHLHRNIQLRLIEKFIGAIAGQAIFPFMAIYFASIYGAKLAGIMMVLVIICRVISGFYGGYFSDNYGRRKVMLYAEYGRFFTYVIMALCNSPFFHSALITYIMLIVSNVATGFSAPAGQAMIIDVSDSSNRKYVYSLSYWSMNLGVAIGGLVGGFLFKEYKFALFLGISLVSLLSIILLTFFIMETYFPQHSNPKKAKVLPNMLKNYKLVLKDFIFVTFTFATLLALSIEFQGRNYGSVRLADDIPFQKLFSNTPFELPIDGVKLFGIMNAENAIMVVILGILLPKITKKLSDKHSFTIGILLYGFGFATVAINNNPLLLLLAILIATAGEVMYWPVVQATLAEIVPEENRSAYMAVNGLVGSGAMMIGSFSVTLGAFLPKQIMGGLFFLTGVISISIFYYVLEKWVASRSIVLEK